MSVVEIVATLFVGAALYTLAMWFFFRDIGKLPPKK